MNLVDTCGWLEYFTNDPNASDYAAALENSESLIVPSICIQEAYRHCLARRTAAVAQMIAARMHRNRVVVHDSAVALLAARLGHKHKLALADSIIYATALIHDAILWTQDAAFRRLPSVHYVQKKKHL